MLIFVEIGITIPALWIRLETRKPKFSMKLDDKSKQYIWKYLVKENDLRYTVRYFLLPSFVITTRHVNHLFRISQLFLFSLCRFYELKKARHPLQLYDRFDYTDPETNICIERVSHLFKSITVDIYSCI